MLDLPCDLILGVSSFSLNQNAFDLAPGVGFNRYPTFNVILFWDRKTRFLGFVWPIISLPLQDSFVEQGRPLHHLPQLIYSLSRLTT